jgi:hypothetical protein
MKTALFIFGMAISCTAFSQQADCAKFAAAVDSDQRKLSTGSVSVRGQSKESAEAIVAATNINSNLLIMAAAKCKLPVEPISSGYYLQNAFDCATKESSGDRSDAAMTACQQFKWERKK